MYLDEGKIYLGLADGKKVELQLPMCNRHGLIAGASGTGKTVTMKVLAESFSDAGVPVFLCDVKGDVSGLCAPGEQTESMEKRIDKFGVRGAFSYRSYPVCFWDVYGQTGHPVRTTVSEMGPELLARILSLTPAQQGLLNIVFRIADDKGLLLTDLKDLRAMINYVSEHKAEFITSYGNIATATVGALVRSLLPLEAQGGNEFFGEPALDIRDWIRTAPDGRGMVNLLDCTVLSQNPTLYAMFLLWMMSELYEDLPEVGDPEKPKLVFFFDEAHTLFTDTPKALVQKIEQVVKLIRSKGVGVYFITQQPSDIPDSVLAQLSNRVQHALRAYTPAEQKAIRAAARSFRANPKFDTETAITELATGEALVSFLDADGIPSVVEKATILPPQSMMGAIDPERRAAEIHADDLYGKYETPVDNESAYEIINRNEAEEAETEKAAEEEKARKKAEEAEAKKKEKAAAKKKSSSVLSKVGNSAMSAAGREIGRSLTRGILDILKKLF